MEARPAPYPVDTRAKGWRLELDHERMDQSDTWALAGSDLRPWLLMLWLVAWKQAPVASLPDDDAVIAAKLGMTAKAFAKARPVLMRGWWRADDGRLYHDVMSQRVSEMVAKKERDRVRKGDYRARKSGDVPRDTTGTDDGHEWDGLGIPLGKTPPSTKHQAPSTQAPSTPDTSSGAHRDKPAHKRAASRVSIEAMVAEGVDAKCAADWLTARAAKHLPLTPTAWEQTKAEAQKAGMTPAEAVQKAAAEGWAGFKALWITEARQTPKNGHQAPASDTAARNAESRRLLGFAPAETHGEVIDA